MKNEDFVELVRKMREAQNAFFAKRSGDNLVKSKMLEKQVDAAIRVQQGFDI